MSFDYKGWNISCGKQYSSLPFICLVKKVTNNKIYIFNVEAESTDLCIKYAKERIDNGLTPEN